MNARKGKISIERLRASLSVIQRSEFPESPGKKPTGANRESVREAFAHFLSFRRLGRAAIGVYLGFVVLLLISLFNGPHFMANLGIAILFLTFLSLLVYATLMQSGFYGALGIGKSGGNPLRIFFMGMPLYILIFLGEERQMLRELSRRVQDSMPHSH